MRRALEICWEPSCYATDGGKFGDSWWVPRELFKRMSPLAAAVPDEDAIPIPDYPNGRDCWDAVRAKEEETPWKAFFVTHADFHQYNHSGMANADPQSHRWCSTKLIFDYTPYVT